MSNKYDERVKELEKQEIEDAKEAYYNGTKHFYREKFSAFVIFYAFVIIALVLFICGVIQFIKNVL